MSPDSPLPPDDVGAPDPTVECVDCGGVCHLLTWEDELAVYRCADCMDVWYIVPDLDL